MIYRGAPSKILIFVAILWYYISAILWEAADRPVGVVRVLFPTFAFQQNFTMVRKRVRMTSEEKLKSQLKKSSSEEVYGKPGDKELTDFPAEEHMSIVTAFRAFKKHGPAELKKFYPEYEGIVIKYRHLELAAFIEQVKSLATE